MVQFWQLSFKIGSNLLRRPGFIGHMTFQEIQQFLKAGVDKFPVSITPLAVLLVEGAVRLPADIGVLQGHTAALTDQLPGGTQQGVDGNSEGYWSIIATKGETSLPVYGVDVDDTVLDSLPCEGIVMFRV